VEVWVFMPTPKPVEARDYLSASAKDKERIAVLKQST